MVRGFYMLGSGMLTQSRVLSGISNNLSNINTSGYKDEKVTTSTFGSMVMDRIDSAKTPIGSVTLMRTADGIKTDYSEGTLKETGRTLDFAIKGQGFFAVQGSNGTVYTRNGNFNVDDQGYLVVEPGGRVLGQNGPIHVGTDNFTADSEGNILVNGQVADKIDVVDFADYNTLQNAGEGLFTASGQPTQVQNPSILWKTLEGSNVDAAQEMTQALSAQRNLQSCSQALQMYDNNLEKAVTEIAKV